MRLPMRGKKQRRRFRPGPGPPSRPRGERSSVLEAIWYGGHPVGLVLAPLGWLFRLAVGLRRLAFSLQLRRTRRVQVPVIVVGNISVGGTGKTPLVIWLSRYLGRDFRPGVVCRGYGGPVANLAAEGPCGQRSGYGGRRSGAAGEALRMSGGGGPGSGGQREGADRARAVQSDPER